MALSRRSANRFQASIWPGFVDAMTGLLLVLMFVLSIFMVIQFVLRETITGQEEMISGQEQTISGQEQELLVLTSEINSLTEALGLARGQVDDLTAESQQQANLIASLRLQRDVQEAALAEANNRISGFEAQVAGLLAERTDLRDQVATLETDKSNLISEADALNLALAQARDEIDAGAEAARLAAARREALEALIADMESQAAERQDQIAALEADATAAQTQISELEAQRLVDAAAAEALRARLENSDAELTAMTLALEEQRAKAEDTLTLLAAANLARQKLEEDLSALQDVNAEALSNLSEAERQAALLKVAQDELAQAEATSAEAQRQTALLNEQVAALRTQVANLQSLLNLAEEADREAQVQIESLGSQLNTALARVAAEQSRRADLEEAERLRLEAEAKNLENYRSEFFGQLRQVLAGQEGIRIEGDRFVFSSEVLFPPGSATLSAAGEGEIAKVAALLRGVASNIPEGIDWIIRVDGHTDNVPLLGTGEFRNNWELSQARALSVVEYMINAQGIPPTRLAANGFGEYQPVNTADTEEARAQNRRIELKLTER